VFVPGILGSELVDSANDQVWPPSLFEVVFGYGRIDELMADDLSPAAVIRSVSVYAVYKTILKDIEQCGYTVGGLQRRLIPYPYDWRRSNAASAKRLADVLGEIDGVTEIVLIGHSMGGLVLRYLLESGRFSHEPWFGRISTLITLGTPHFGAPQALKKLLGDESQLGISGPDLVKLASDERFPSLYQLVSSPESALTVPQAPPGEVPQKMESFAAPIANALNLNPQNIRSARDFWATLDVAGRRPAHVDYFLFGGAAHKTTVRNEWSDPDLEPIERRQSGDGTVPISSAIVPELPHGFSEKKHARIFEDRDLRQALYRFLDAPVGVKPQAADDTVEVGDRSAFGISVDKENYAVGEAIEIVASYNEEVSDPSESFRILRLDSDTGERDPAAVPTVVDVDFRGVSLTSFSFVLKPDLSPGLYELRPNRRLDDPEPTLFVVVESHG
jgi:pimeloyl-ACP methyl ester carboxylesterase